MKNSLLLFWFILLTLPLSANIIYVAHDASGDRNGSSWTHAYVHPSDAFSAAGWSGNDTVFIKAGTYYPDRRTNGQSQPNKREEFTFHVEKPLYIFGGFAGNESKPEQRNLEVYTTVLSGDLGSEKVYHVLTVGSTSSVLIDGLTITDGDADANGNGVDSRGGGLIASNLNSLTLRNIRLEGNEAAGDGGGAYISNLSSLDMTNVTACGNEAEYGGALYCRKLSSAHLLGFKAVGNEAAEDGGAIYAKNLSGFNLTNGLFYQNEAEKKGGAFFARQFSGATFVNSTFYQNEADDQGVSIYTEQHSSLSVYNTILYGCDDPGCQQVETTSNSTVQIVHSLLQGSIGSDGTWASAATDGGGNLDLNPMFVDPDGADNIPCTPDDNFFLDPSSPALDAGTSQGVANFPSEDLLGSNRVQGSAPDLGAFEGTGSSGTFPVEWLNFAGRWVAGGQSAVQLDWATAQEINSDRFEVQRRLDGEADWTTLGAVQSVGFSDQVSHYRFVDQGAGDLWAEKLHYRLKQVDLDGAYSYSSTLTLSMERSLERQVMLYPNPATERVFVATDLPSGLKVERIEVLDLQGRVLMAQPIAGQQTTYEVPLHTLQPGMYLLRLSTNQGQAGKLLRVE